MRGRHVTAVRDGELPAGEARASADATVVMGGAARRRTGGPRERGRHCTNGRSREEEDGRPVQARTPLAGA